MLGVSGEGLLSVIKGFYQGFFLHKSIVFLENLPLSINITNSSLARSLLELSTEAFILSNLTSSNLILILPYQVLLVCD